MNSVRINIRVDGVTPLILNKFTDKAQLEASGGSRGSSAAADRGTAHEIAESKLYLDIDGKTPVMPSPNMLRCIIDGGSFHKAGKSKITTQKTSMIPACVFIGAATIGIIHTQPWRVDTRAVRIPSTGGRILAHRPVFEDWSLEFEMTLDTSIIGAKVLREIVDSAGQRIGLGDFRPACKGPFGRFVVTKWVVDEMKAHKAA
jgi:hypothetical protein